MNCGCHSHNGLLTATGRQAAQQLSLEGLAPRGVHEYLDKVGSVSALRRDEITMEFHEDIINEQYRRFLNEVEEL